MNQINSRVKGATKMERAAEIFDSMPNSPRHEVVAAFQNQLSMSAAGASTYYQLNRQRCGLVGVKH